MEEGSVKEIKIEENSTDSKVDSDQNESNKKRKVEAHKQDSDEEDEAMEGSLSEIVIPDSLKILYDDGKLLAVSKISGLFYLIS